jgi:hypothetical protein
MSPQEELLWIKKTGVFGPDSTKMDIFSPFISETIAVTLSWLILAQLKRQASLKLHQK